MINKNCYDQYDNLILFKNVISNAAKPTGYISLKIGNNSSLKQKIPNYALYWHTQYDIILNFFRNFYL